jgi:hypothetical protein
MPHSVHVTLAHTDFKNCAATAQQEEPTSVHLLKRVPCRKVPLLSSPLLLQTMFLLVQKDGPLILIFDFIPQVSHGIGVCSSKPHLCRLIAKCCFRMQALQKSVDQLLWNVQVLLPPQDAIHTVQPRHPGQKKILPQLILVWSQDQIVNEPMLLIC